MIDYRWFIYESLYCEYAYIINLDTDELEIYVGHQREPQPGNRYGETSNDHGYYPCALLTKYDLHHLPNQILDKEFAQ
jgi:hypothetical protein